MTDIISTEESVHPGKWPPDGTYMSRRGVAIRVIRRRVPDSREGSIEIAVFYGRGGAQRESELSSPESDGLKTKQLHSKGKGTV